MDYEQKYRESMAKMSTFLAKYDGFTISKDGEMYKELSAIFPELKESEDDRIRNSIIAGMFALKEQNKDTFANVSLDDCIAWLEKQEQKSWGEEDEQHRKWILAYLYDGLYKANEPFKGQFKTAIAWFEKQRNKE